MKKLFAIFAVGAAMFSLATVASATVLTFDDITSDDWDAPVPSGYGGLPLEWSNIGVVVEGYSGGYYGKSAVSGDYAAYNGDGEEASTASLSSGTFNFYGAYFTTAAKSAGVDGDIEVRGYLDGTQVGTTTTIELVSLADPLWVDFDLAGIDELVFTPLRTGHGAYFAMDNFTGSVVPEPISFVIWSLLTVVGMTFAGWRRR